MEGLRIVIGLGKTGLSCARFFSRQGIPFAVADTRDNPPGVADFRREFPGVKLVTGPLSLAFLKQAELLVVSPGVPLADPVIEAARAAGVRVAGDVAIFSNLALRPLVGITGSNGKTTVTTLLGEMARQGGIRAGVCGNIGTPVLDLLGQDEMELYVLELSSFQLETTDCLNAEVATVLNVSEDHMDRYEDFAAYCAAKYRVFRGCRQAVINLDDPRSYPGDLAAARKLRYSILQSPMDSEGFGLSGDPEPCLVQGSEALLPVADLKIKGLHNISNALAALALGTGAGFPRGAMLEALLNFRGLPHRCEWVASKAGVEFINDSKGTNVGASLAAIGGLKLPGDGRIVLIAGGDGKGADFSPLAPAVEAAARGAVLIGRDGPLIEQHLRGKVPVVMARDMAEAVSQAAAMAKPGDIVLLSPACASFDMYDSFEQRGQTFIREVERL